MPIIAVVGMAGAGKSEVSRMFQAHGWSRLRFGDVTDDELARRGLPQNEANERIVREELREKHGMDAYAKLIIPKIDEQLAGGDIVLDGLYSWEEYLILKDKYGDELKLLAVYTTRALRYGRLGKREIRPLTSEEALSRDCSEIENLHKAGPIAIADHIIVNNGNMDDLRKDVESYLDQLNNL